MAFIENRMLDKVEFGSRTSTVYSTTVSEMGNGHEQRNANWSEPRQELRIIFKNISLKERDQVQGAFDVAMGRFYGFRVRDPFNYVTNGAQVIGVGTGAPQSLQLTISRKFGDTVRTKAIKKPVRGTVIIQANGKVVDAHVNYSTGVVELTAEDGAIISWLGEYDTPVRFDKDSLEWSYDRKASASMCNGDLTGAICSTDVSLIEIKDIL